jgi:hypothetical protein
MLVPVLALAMQVSSIDKGGDLYTDCQAIIRHEDNPDGHQSDMDFARSVGCYSYIEGYTDALHEENPSPICLNGATLGTIVRVYLHYMDSHPKLRDVEKSIGVYWAIHDNYGCSASHR